MKIPVMQGVIDRRMLVNYRVRADCLRSILPPPFQPKLIDGWGIAGICLIRLKHLRPRIIPKALGLTSENAAHRIAVEWDAKDGRQEGVFIIRRDSSSHINSLGGGRIFPGVHHHATFQVREQNERFELMMRSDDDETRVEIQASITPDFPQNSIFGSLDGASRFFEDGSIGYSSARDESFDGLELRVEQWNVEPLAVQAVHSSFFEDPTRFGKDDAEFDCALLMRNIEHEWHQCESICGTMENVRSE